MCRVIVKMNCIASRILDFILRYDYVVAIDDPDCGLLAYTSVVVRGNRISEYLDVISPVFDVHACTPSYSVIVRDLNVVSAGDAHAEAAIGS